MWFIEDPWTPGFVLFIVTAIFALVWSQTRRPRDLIVAGTAFVVAAIGFGIDALVQTPAEEVEQMTIALVRNFEADREAEVLDQFSPGVIANNAAFFNQVGLYMERIEHPTPLRVTDVNVTLLAEGTRAETDFRVNGTFVYDGTQMTKPTRWLIMRQREGADKAWKIIRVTPIDPIKGTRLSFIPSLE